MSCIKTFWARMKIERLVKATRVFSVHCQVWERPERVELVNSEAEETSFEEPKTKLSVMRRAKKPKMANLRVERAAFHPARVVLTEFGIG